MFFFNLTCLGSSNFIVRKPTCFLLWSTKAAREKEGAHCVSILVCRVDNGAERKTHTCLQINWFGQEASKEELYVVKQACGEAGMSQQKHHYDHGEEHDAELNITHRYYTHTCLCGHTSGVTKQFTGGPRFNIEKNDQLPNRTFRYCSTKIKWFSNSQCLTCFYC